MYILRNKSTFFSKELNKIKKILEYLKNENVSCFSINQN